MVRLTLLATLITLAVAATVPETKIPSTASLAPEKIGCRYWCRNHDNRVYCCETNDKPNIKVDVKPGQCPVIRNECPELMRTSGPKPNLGKPPKTCAHDTSCPGAERCCYDRCLKASVCKQPINDNCGNAIYPNIQNSGINVPATGTAASVGTVGTAKTAGMTGTVGTAGAPSAVGTTGTVGTAGTARATAAVGTAGTARTL